MLAGLLAQFLLPSGTVPPQDSAVAARRPRSPVAARIPAYPAVLRQPLFAPDRQPGEAAAETTDAGNASPLALVGLALGGHRASAVVRTADGTSHVLQPGQSLAGWTLLAVGPASASVVGPAGRVVLKLGDPAAAGAPAAAGLNNAAAQPPVAQPAPQPSVGFVPRGRFGGGHASYLVSAQGPEA